MSSIEYRKTVFAAALLSMAWTLLPASGLVLAQGNAPALRYGFQAGKQYAFDVKIEVQMDEYDEIRSGVLSYAVTSAKDGQFELRPSGNLSVQTKMHANQTGIPRGFPPFGPMGPRGMMGPRFMGPGGPQGITINQRGEKIVSRELTQLPYLLGEMEMLVIEELPVDARPNWEKQTDLAVLERDSDSPFPRFRFGPTSDADGKRTTAKERTNYSIVKSDKDSVEVSKKYSLTTSAEANKPSRFEMTGDGQFTFDMNEGVVKTCSMKYECRVNETNLSLRIPISVTYRLLSPEELAEQQKKAEAAKAAAEKAKEPKQFASGERAQLLRDLRSSDTHRITTAADRLATAPATDNPAQVAKALASLLGHSDIWVQRAAAKALVVWGAPEAENALIKASQADDVFLRNPAIEALGKLKSPKAAEAVAAQMYQQSSRQDVSKALKGMGPIAEDATIGLLKDRDMWVRAEACAVLGEIGGKKSLQALHDFTPKSPGLEEHNAKKAIADIERRLESGSDDTADSDSAKAEPAEGSAGLRTWRDATGTFSVEATMLSIENGNVVLQRKDGKQIRVPVAKLSPADKKYAAEHAADAKNKAENPFE